MKRSVAGVLAAVMVATGLATVSVQAATSQDAEQWRNLNQTQLRKAMLKPREVHRTIEKPVALWGHWRQKGKDDIGWGSEYVWSLACSRYTLPRPMTEGRVLYASTALRNGWQFNITTTQFSTPKAARFVLADIRKQYRGKCTRWRRDGKWNIAGRVRYAATDRGTGCFNVREAWYSTNRRKMPLVGKQSYTFCAKGPAVIATKTRHDDLWNTKDGFALALNQKSRYARFARR